MHARLKPLHQRLDLLTRAAFRPRRPSRPSAAGARVPPASFRVGANDADQWHHPSHPVDTNGRRAIIHFSQSRRRVAVVVIRRRQLNRRMRCAVLFRECRCLPVLASELCLSLLIPQPMMHFYSIFVVFLFQ